MTRSALWMSCWAVPTVGRSGSSPSSWPNCARSSPCPYFQVSNHNSPWNLNHNTFLVVADYRNHTPLPKRSGGCAGPAAAVPPALAAEHGTGGHQCAARHAPVLHYGKPGMKLLSASFPANEFVDSSTFPSFRSISRTQGHEVDARAPAPPRQLKWFSTISSTSRPRYVMDIWASTWMDTSSRSSLIFNLVHVSHVVLGRPSAGHRGAVGHPLPVLAQQP